MAENSLFILILYGLIGIAGALSVIVFVWGFVVYISRLGTQRRDEGIHTMEWGVGLVLTAIFLIGFLRFMQYWFGIGTP